MIEKMPQRYACEALRRELCFHLRDPQECPERSEDRVNLDDCGVDHLFQQRLIEVFDARELEPLTQSAKGCSKIVGDVS